ncbi:TatD family nuclease-associated radical SAM protein [Acidiferrobacter sp.]|uniref:TatD family nuclease-associated radical SAM protein n=1 Tax=Acidiferrobacter sp. TaxID=1872107 RepID=UPI002626D2E7|nr:TatD family nuclease-associated radical SAM protein [Acidiferrobacter sp.]
MNVKVGWGVPGTMAVARGDDAGRAPSAVAAYRLRDAVYLNLTNRCTLRCRFCPKFHGLWTVGEARLRLRASEEPSVTAVIEAARALGSCTEYVFCGLGEPTTRWSALLAVAAALRTEGRPIRLNTDGLASLIHGRDVAPELAGLVDHVSISLNAADERTYEHLCRPSRAGSYSAMLAFAARARTFVPRVTLTAIAGLEGVDLDACARIARELGVAFRARPLESTDGRSFRVR